MEGHRQFNPGWHLALDLDNMLLVSECVARAALMREESRGGHTRDDFPGMNPAWRLTNLICTTDGDERPGEEATPADHAERAAFALRTRRAGQVPDR